MNENNKEVCKCYINKNIDFELFEKVREDFEYTKKDVIYLDSSATSQKPKKVIDEIINFYSNYCANSDRGNYEWTKKVDKKIESSRKTVAKFINADIDEIVFTSGATHASNLIAYSYGLKNLKTGDEILLCNEDHKSTVLPYYNIKDILQNFGTSVSIKEILIDIQGDYKEDDLVSKVNENTKIVVLTHIHNGFGLEMDIDKLVPRIREKNKNCKIVLDCSQSIGHINVDVKKLDVDFAYFSGHKVFSSMGIGVCYIKKENYKYLSAFLVGGGFEFSKDKTFKIDNYKQLESGTKNIEGIITLGAAIEYIQNISIEKIEAYINYLTRYAYENLKKIKGINFTKGINNCTCPVGYGIIGFNLERFSNYELEEVLSDYGIYARSGDFCTYNSEKTFIRISLHIYNNKDDIDKLIKVLKYISEEI